MHPVFIVELFMIVKTRKLFKCPSVDKWIKKMWYTHTHTRILLSHKKNKNLPFARTWIYLESIMLSEISEKEKEKYCVISLYMDSKRYNKTSEYNKKETGSQIYRTN